MKYQYEVIYEPLEEGGFNIVVPSIPEICTFGETLGEAKEMAEDALRCYLESAQMLGEEIPSNDNQNPNKEFITIELAMT